LYIENFKDETFTYSKINPRKDGHLNANILELENDAELGLEPLQPEFYFTS
jgi:hypothetical protein